MLLTIWTLAAIFAIFCVFRYLLGRITVSGLNRKFVLITGCDSGFGFDLALRCLANGVHVFAACLSEEGCERLMAASGREKMPGCLHVFGMNVSSAESVSKGIDFVRPKLPPGQGLHAVVCNAGIVGNVGWDDWLLPQDYEDVWQVNTMGTIRVTQAFKGLLKKEPQSRLIVMASTCGRVALPGLGPYTVSKYAVEAYADTIRSNIYVFPIHFFNRSEFILFGVKVCILEPGFFRTPLTSAQRNAAMLDSVWERMSESQKREHGEALYQFTRKQMLNMLDPSKLESNTDLVVDAYWHAISAAWPKRRYQVGSDIKWFFLPFSFLPAEIQDLFFRLIKFIERPPIRKKSINDGKNIS